MSRWVTVVSVCAVAAATFGLTSCTSQSEPEPAPSAKTVSQNFAMPTETAAMYRGLPNSIANNPEGPAVSVTSTETADYQKFQGNAEYLSGAFPKGVRVKRGGRPEITDITVNDNGEVTAKVKATKATVGGKSIPAGAKELLAVNVVVTDNNPNPSRRVVLFQDLQWFEIKGGQLNQTVSATVDQNVAQQLKGLSAEQRGEAIVVYAVQVIDVDGVLMGDRYSADHIKGTTLNYASAQAATQAVAQGVELALNNADYQTGTSASLPINLTANSVSCMDTNGSGASDFSTFNISQMGQGETVEGFLASSTTGQAANQAPAAEDVVDAMTEDYAKAVVEAMAGLTLDWTDAAFDVFEEIAKLALTGCGGVSNPGLFTLAATDSAGNASQIGYSLNTEYNDTSSGIDIGGMADVNTAYNFYNGVSGGGVGPTGVAEYISSDYLENNFGPGPAGTSFVQAAPVGATTTPITGSGGDAGLSWQAMTSGGYPQLGTENGYPQIQLNATWGSSCTSLIGGMWGTGTSDGDTFGGSIPGFTQNPCAGWSTAPTPNPLPAPPTMVSGPTISPTTAMAGTVMTTTQGSWQPSSAAISIAWDINGKPQSGQTGTTFTIPSNVAAGSTVTSHVCAVSDGQQLCSSSNTVTISGSASPAATASPSVS